jgi:Zn-dependent protease
MQDLNIIFYIVVLIMSVVIHEVAHGYAALRFGDQTAKFAGRLTLNPLKHLDMFGSVLLPIILIITKAPFLLGWAKPVPYNPNNFIEKKKGTLWVASAGILANLAIATLFGITIRLNTLSGFLGESFVTLASVVVLINIVLAIFNLIPITPLDGSKILFTLLGRTGNRLEAFSEKYSLFILIFFIFFLWRFLTPIIFNLFALLTGLGL